MEKVAFILCAVVAVAQAATLPPEIVTCKKSDPNYKACLLKAITDATKFLAGGNKKLGVPGVDPVYIPNIHIAGNGGSVDLDQTYLETNLHGITGGEFTDAKIDLDGDNCKMHLELQSPNVQLIGKYKVSGKLLLFTLGGHGPANITLVNLKVKLDFTCKKIDRKGETYLEITDTGVVLSPEKLLFDIGNLIDGNEELSANVLKVMNDNDAEIFKELKADYERVFSAVFQALAAPIFKNIPVKNIFPS